mgnify:CR=1 FL=1
MSTNFSKLDQAFEHGYRVDIGHFLGRSLSVFQKYPGLFILYTLFWFLISAFTQFLPILGQLIAIVISYPLMVGFYLGGHQADRDRPLAFLDFFKGFDYLGDLVAIYLIQMATIIGLLLPLLVLFGFEFFFSVGTYDLPGDSSLAIAVILVLILLIPFLYLNISWLWAPLFVVFHGMSFWPALENSRKLLTRQWGMYFVFLLILGLLSLAGFLALFIGILITVPIAYLAIYVSFAEIVGFPDDQADNQITDHLVG